MPRTSLALPSVDQYVEAMLAASGPYTVCGVFYRDHDRAAIARRRLAQMWCDDDQRRAARIRQQQRGVFAVAH